MDTRALVIEMLTFVRHHPEKLLNPESNYTPGNLKLIEGRLEGVVMSLDNKIGFLDGPLWFNQGDCEILSLAFNCPHILIMTEQAERPIVLHDGSNTKSFTSPFEFTERMFSKLWDGFVVTKGMAHSNGHFNALVIPDGKAHSMMPGAKMQWPSLRHVRVRKKTRMEDDAISNGVSSPVAVSPCSARQTPASAVSVGLVLATSPCSARPTTTQQADKWRTELVRQHYTPALKTVQAVASSGCAHGWCPRKKIRFGLPGVRDGRSSVCAS